MVLVRERFKGNRNNQVLGAEQEGLARRIRRQPIETAKPLLSRRSTALRERDRPGDVLWLCQLQPNRQTQF